MDKETRQQIMESQERAEKEFKAQREAFQQDMEEITRSDVAEFERIKQGGIDFSLYNYVLSTVNFRDIRKLNEGNDHFTLDSMQRMYEGVHPYILKLQNLCIEYNKLLQRLENHKILSNVESEAFAELAGRVHDYIEYAKTPMKEIQRRASERAKRKVYVPHSSTKIEVVK